MLPGVSLRGTAAVPARRRTQTRSNVQPVLRNKSSSTWHVAPSCYPYPIEAFANFYHVDVRAPILELLAATSRQCYHQSSAAVYDYYATVAVVLRCRRQYIVVASHTVSCHRVIVVSGVAPRRLTARLPVPDSYQKAPIACTCARASVAFVDSELETGS